MDSGELPVWLVLVGLAVTVFILARHWVRWELKQEEVEK